MEGELTKKLAKGVKKGNCAITITITIILSIYVRVYNNCVNATNKRMCLGYKKTMCARIKIHAFNFMDPPEW